MRRAPLPALALLLGACSLFGPRERPIDDSPEQRACRAEADRAPALRALDAQRNPGMDIAQPRLDDEARRIRIGAYRDCLRRAGLGLPGGVEPLRTR